MYQNLTVLSGPAVEPISLPTARSFLRVVIPDDDAIISLLISAARRYVEARLKTTLVNTSYMLAMDWFPSTFVRQSEGLYNANTFNPWLIGSNFGSSEFILPMGPVSSITAIQYYDVNGGLQTVDPTTYLLLQGNPARVSPSYGKLWAIPQGRIGSVTVNYVAGLGPDGSTTPENVKIAILMLISHFYVNREAASEGTLGEIPFGVDALLESAGSGIGLFG